MIEALPAILERRPDVTYVIAGRTHPDISRREGERYRLMLEQRVLELGLGEHVEFDDRFLSIDELVEAARGDGRVRDPVPEPRADRLRRAHLRARGRLRRRLDTVLVRPGHARLGRRHASSRSTIRRRSPTAVCGYLDHPETLAAARAEARRVVVVALLAVGRRGDRLGAARRRPSSPLGAGRPAPPICI